MSYTTLPYSIQISKKRHWQLMRLVYASNEQGHVDPMKPYRKPATLADDILGDWIDRTCPQLNVLWDRREAIETEAAKEALDVIKDT